MEQIRISAQETVDFNEDLNLWRELKLTLSPGRLFHSVTTRSEKT